MTISLYYSIIFLYCSNPSLYSHKSVPLQSQIDQIKQFGAMHSQVEKTYKKVSQIQHVLLRPDVYIGPTDPTEEVMWVVEEEQIVKKRIRYIPGLFKIFDEVLVNAADNYQRDRKMKEISVQVTRDRVTVKNDGKGIPVQIHKTHQIHVPQLIFGHLLTSSNYQDSEKKVVGGRNGFGAKLANLFSSSFTIEVADSLNKKLYEQTWTNNMTEMGEARVKNYSGSDYTKVEFKPDFKRFGIGRFSEDMINLMKRRVFDISGILKVKVSLNGEIVKVPNFREYAKMYLDSPDEQMIEAKEKNGRWHVLASRSEGEFSQISFVNGIATTRGGSHVNYILDQIVSKVIESLTKKKSVNIRPFQVKNNLNLFINCLIENPCFDSQTKETMTLKPQLFGSSCTISDDFIKDLLKTGIGERILNDVKAKQNSKIERELKKAKKNRLIIPKLEDANQAGRSNKCCLILTEGDSAKALALCGIQELGRDYFGVFPLRGKLLNVKDMNPKQAMQNAQISNIVKILGLSFGKQYKNTNDLRYSTVMIMADQDTDGSHIKGLVINFFQTFWPSLCKIDGFLKQFITPIIKCKKGDTVMNFYSLVDFKQWQQNSQGWSIKYYKGLGTSTSKEAKEYFKHLKMHQIHFSCQQEQDGEALDLAFNKQKANLRKDWLSEYDPQSGLDHRVKKVTVQDFVNKELIHFSIADNMRSIPSLVDGLKPSQRKILFACFKRNLNSEIKVAQLAGYVAEHSAYHHGEMSLCGAIVSMAQNFVGSNNLNLLEPIGQFGTRYERGADHASSRYIFTKLNPLTRYLFKEEDDHVVEYQTEDNQTIEPLYYLPIIPIILINGAEGIGTGWSTSVHPYKVEDVIEVMKDRLRGRDRQIDVGWQKFKGSVERTSDRNFMVHGQYQVEEQTVTIRQIPPSKSIRNYKSFLEQKLESLDNSDPDLEDLKEYHQDNQIEFVLRFFPEKMPSRRQLQKYLKLSSSCQMGNMNLFTAERKIKKFGSVKEIVDEFYEQRLEGYRRRKRYLLSKFRKESLIIENQIRFIGEIIDGHFKMIQTKDEWISKLKAHSFDKYQDLNKVESTKNREEEQNQKNRDYSYLLSMPIWSFCQEKIRDMTLAQQELQTVINYYQKTTEIEMWIKDIEHFESAWEKHQSGLEVKQNLKDRRKINPKSNNKRRQKSEEQEEKTEKKEGRRRRRGNMMEEEVSNMMEEEVQNLMENKETKKKGKKNEEFLDLNEMKAIDLGEGKGLKKLQRMEQEKQQKSGLEAILSKYLCESEDKGGQLTLLERIKSRISNPDSSFAASYKQTKEQLSELKKKEKEESEDEDIKAYLI